VRKSQREFQRKRTPAVKQPRQSAASNIIPLRHSYIFLQRIHSIISRANILGYDTIGKKDWKQEIQTISAIIREKVG
jgi:hypothetical protein